MIFAAGACVLLLAAGASARAAAESVAELQARFDREPNSVQKARILSKLAAAEFAETRRASDKGDFQTVGQLMEKYRDNVRVALGALHKEHPAAEKEYGGYRVLELTVRKSRKELDDIIVIAPPDLRPPLELVRTDLEHMHDDLMRSLFPRRPGEKRTAPQVL